MYISFFEHFYSLFEQSLQECGGISVLTIRYFFRGSCRENQSALPATFWTHVDDMVGQFDDIQIVFDDDDGIASVNQFLENVHEDSDVLEV